MQFEQLTAGSAGSGLPVPMVQRPFEVGMVHLLVHRSCSRKMLLEVEVVVLELV